MASEREWPQGQPDGSERGGPVGWFKHPDGFLKSSRQLAGSLRHGTAPGVGPRGSAIEADNTARTDFGTDRISPKDFDPMGTTRNRSSEIESDLIARQVRRR
jgi:hypothetical protein